MRWLVSLRVCDWLGNAISSMLYIPVRADVPNHRWEASGLFWEIILDKK
jgi:hypothetical protein